MKQLITAISIVFLFATQSLALNVVRLGPEYFPDPDRSRAIANGYIYVGEPDLDPTVEANQKQIKVRQEDGSVVDVSQPVRTNSGGVPIYQGSPVTVLVDGNYSLLIHSSQQSQKYYVPLNDVETQLSERKYIVSGFGNSIILTSESDSVDGYNNGDTFLFKAIASNDGPVVLNVDSLGSRPVLKQATNGLIPLTRLEISSGNWSKVVYDESEASFIIRLPQDRQFTNVDNGLAFGSDILQGRSWNSDLVGAQSANPYVQGRVGTVSNTWASGDTISLRLQWTGTGGAQDETATFIASDNSVSNIASGLVSALRVNSTILSDWWFNSSGGSINIQYKSAVNGTPITPVWTATATTVGDGTFTLGTNSTALDTAPWEFFTRSVEGRNAQNGDSLYALVSQSSDSSTDQVSTWYGTIVNRIINSDTQNRESVWSIGTADPSSGLSGARTRLQIQRGVLVLEGGSLPTGGDKGDGAFNANHIYQSNKGVISGDATSGRVIRKVVLVVSDGTNPNTIKCQLANRWNGDNIAITDNIFVGSTVGDFTLNGSGTSITIESSGISGSAVSILSTDIYANTSTTALDIFGNASNGNMVLTLYGSNDGVAKSAQLLTNTGGFSIEIAYITDA